MVKFRNVARDINCSIKQYRCWSSDGYIDQDGYYFYGPKSGNNKLINFNHYSIPDGYAGDFLLPNAEKVNNSKYTLPFICDGSSSTIIDGYIYLFGGKDSDKILRASINDPNKWVDTGNVLPRKINGASLILHNSTVYLVGGKIGNGDGYSEQNVYYANISDLSSWSEEEEALPEKLSYSSVLSLNNRFYLFGGSGSFNSTNKIYVSNIGNPLVWSIHSTTLPEAFHSSTILVDGYLNKVHLFGGINNDGWTKNIYSSDDLSLNNITISGNLPHEIAGGKAFVIGDNAYIYSHISSIINNIPVTEDHECKIFKCNKFNLINGWIDSGFTIKNYAYNSNLLIVNDRIYIFGGSGSSNIQVSEQKISVEYNVLETILYDLNTRIYYNNTNLGYEKTLLLGFNNWMANY